jgi:AraC-like DNA-binding protein
MRTIQVAAPRIELRQFVRSYAAREMTCSGAGFEQPVIASLENILSFNFRELEVINYSDGRSKAVSPIQVVGLQTQPFCSVRFSGSVLAFGIFLRPLALWQLFGIPPKLLTNGAGAGADLLGREIEDLWAMLAESKSFSHRVRVAEGYMLPYATRALTPTPVMRSAQHLFRRRGAIRIDALARNVTLSMRQYERRFSEEIGVAPKLFARITRFQVALDAKRLAPARSWLSIAHELGYFDQTHMIQDFQILGGDAPSRLFQRCGDIQPWSLATLSEDKSTSEVRALPNNGLFRG